MPMSINRTAQSAYTLAAGEGQSDGAVGVTITFKTVGEQSAGQLLALEYAAPARFQGPPPHWHKVMTEIFYVIEGALALTASGQTTTLGPGGYAFVPPGVVHTFGNPNDAPARFFVVASPAGLENYFRELKELIRDEPQWPPKDMRKVIALMAKYDTFAPDAE